MATRFFSPAAQMVGNTVCKIFDADEPECLMNAVVDRFRIQSEIGRAKSDILFYRRGKYLVIGILENYTDKFSHLTDICAGNRFAAD